MKGWIYIATNPSLGEGKYKIGQTDNPNQRIQGLSRTNVIQGYRYLFCHQSIYALKAEQMIFKMLAEYRIDPKKEFFKVDLNLAISICYEVIEKIDSDPLMDSSKEEGLSEDELFWLESRY